MLTKAEAHCTAFSLEVCFGVMNFILAQFCIYQGLHQKECRFGISLQEGQLPFPHALRLQSCPETVEFCSCLENHNGFLLAYVCSNGIIYTLKHNTSE